MSSRISPRIFAVAYCAAYALVFAAEWPLFIYYPMAKGFSWGWAPVTGIGPGMAWYGLMTSAAIIALIVAVALPDRVIGKTLSNRLWVVPVVAMLVSVFLLRKFFL